MTIPDPGQVFLEGEEVHFRSPIDATAAGIEMTLMLTAGDTSDDRISGLALGADDYLTKPFHSPNWWVLHIRALARRQPNARPRVHRAAGLTLDPQRHTATRNGLPLDLSVKEFAVLEDLLRAAPPS